MGTHKGSWDRSNPQKVQESEYWKAENVEKRKAIAKASSAGFRGEYWKKENMEKSKMIAKAFSEGWRDIHDGEIMSQAKYDQLKQDVIKLHTPTIDPKWIIPDETEAMAAHLRKDSIKLHKTY